MGTGVSLFYIASAGYNRRKARNPMLSWSLWKSIKDPPMGHPVFQRASIEQPIEFPWITSPFIKRFTRLLVGVLAIIVFLQNPKLILMVFMGSAFFVLAIIVTPLLLPLAIFVYGSYLAASISSVISTEKNAHTYSLLCVSPGGSLNINWIIGGGVLHRGSPFEWLHAAIRTVIVISLVGMLVIAVIIISMTVSMLSGNEVPALPDALRTSVEILAILAVFYSGYIQSLILAVIVGILVPQFDYRKRDMPVTAVVSYLVMQSGTYLVALLIIVATSDQVYGFSLGADLLLPLLYFLILFGIRELAIRWLWQQLIHRLNANPGDLAHLHVHHALWFPKNRSNPT